MALFRKHRGMLEDSLKTTVIVKTHGELVQALFNDSEQWPSMNRDFKVKIEPYPNMENCFDKRCGWYTQMVLSDRHEEGKFQPEGFLSEPLHG